MILRRILTVTALLATLLAPVGCGKGGGSFATVSGVVTHNGTPVEGAKIIFQSTTEVDGKQAAAFAAVTDSSGKYLIASVGKDPGIPPAMYKVAISKIEGKELNPGGGIDAGQMDAMTSDGGGSAKGGPVNRLPAIYANVASSKLSATLEPGKNQNVNFDLKGK